MSPMTSVPTSGTNAPVFRFDSEQHEYFLNGERIPGVTEMMDLMGWVDDSRFTSESRDRGHMVHRLCCDYLLGAIRDPREVECIYKGWFLAFCAIWKTMKPRVLSVEVARYSPQYRFGLRPDITAVLWGAKGVIDIKTGAKADEHGYQTALYAIGVAPELSLPPRAVQRHILYLKENGRARLEECKDARDFDKAYRAIKECCSCPVTP